ncbi:MAG TPA: hypothetical protein VMZ92_14210 [Planctomycetota bacterium]|nr:hypothetical protein [Planctomycetota bacterium]
MEVIIFGKLKCGRCKGTQSRVSVLIEKMGLTDRVSMRFVDVETIDGRAEGAFHDVYDAVPVTIIRNDGRDIGRWDGMMPRTEDLTPHFESAAGVSEH